MNVPERIIRGPRIAGVLARQMLERERPSSALDNASGSLMKFNKGAIQPKKREEVKPERLWTAKEIADYLQLKLDTVYAWAARGKLPCVRMNRTVRFDFEKVRKWLGQYEQDGYY